MAIKRTSATLPLSNNFTAGLLDPSLRMNPQFADRANGCSTLKNFYVLNQGGVAKRPGLRRLRIALDNNNFEWSLHPFNAGGGDDRFVIAAGINKTSSDLFIGIYRIDRNNEAAQVFGHTISNPFARTGQSAKDLKLVQAEADAFFIHPSMPIQRLRYNEDGGNAIWTVENLEIINPPARSVNMTLEEAQSAFGESRAYEIPKDAGEVFFRAKETAPQSDKDRGDVTTPPDGTTILWKNYNQFQKAYYVTWAQSSAPVVEEYAITDSNSDYMQAPPDVDPTPQPAGVYVTRFGGIVGFPQVGIHYDRRLWLAAGSVITRSVANNPSLICRT